MNNLNFGRVKWFGGLNRKTNKENDYGFMESLEGDDVFLHKSALAGGALPKEDDVLVYEYQERQGRASAWNAQHLADSRVSVVWIFEALRKLKRLPGVFETSQLSRPLLTEFGQRLLSANLEELDALRSTGEDCSAFELLYELRSLGFASWNNSSATQEKAYALLAEPLGPKALEVIPWKFMPPSALADEEGMALQLSSMAPNEATALALRNIDNIPTAVLFFLCIKGLLRTREQLGSRHTALEQMVRSLYRSRAPALPGFVKAAYDTDLKPNGGYRSVPVLWELIEPNLLKQYLFEKNEKYFGLYHGSTSLRKSLETFVIFNLLSLWHLGNDEDAVTAVFKQRLWEALATGQLDLTDQTEAIGRAFPSCSTFPLGRLSCEAVYWPKGDKYLCRGKDCLNPKVLPDLSKHYIDFTVYDWLAHYGVDYREAERPANRDFAIKLAGYFNRLREIFPVLHCRSCNQLMVPNFKYARTTYIDFEDGQQVEKQMAAAYRLTVFHCNNEDCNQFDIGYYINHCIGFGCYDIIDARDLKIKCDHDRYVCKGCGSCCEAHSTAKPVGICGFCGNDLTISESKESNYLGKRLRLVRCSAACGFELRPALPQKFYGEHATACLINLNP